MATTHPSASEDGASAACNRNQLVAILFNERPLKLLRKAAVKGVRDYDRGAVVPLEWYQNLCKYATHETDNPPTPIANTLKIFLSDWVVLLGKSTTVQLARVLGASSPTMVDLSEVEESAAARLILPRLFDLSGRETYWLLLMNLYNNNTKGEVVEHRQRLFYVRKDLSIKALRGCMSSVPFLKQFDTLLDQSPFNRFEVQHQKWSEVVYTRLVSVSSILELHSNQSDDTKIEIAVLEKYVDPGFFARLFNI